MLDAESMLAPANLSWLGVCWKKVVAAASAKLQLTIAEEFIFLLGPMDIDLVAIYSYHGASLLPWFRGS